MRRCESDLEGCNLGDLGLMELAQSLGQAVMRRERKSVMMQGLTLGVQRVMCRVEAMVVLTVPWFNPNRILVFAHQSRSVYVKLVCAKGRMACSLG